MRYLGEDDVHRMMGIGAVGEVRQGPDGHLYQWVQGVDGLGNPIGFWQALLRVGRGLRRGAQRALPIVQQVAPLIAGGGVVTAALRAATPLLRRAGVAGHNSLGALYQAPDGTMYQVQGLGQEEELRGLSEDEEVQGVAENDELQGLAEDEEIQGFGEDEDLQGLEQGGSAPDLLNPCDIYAPFPPEASSMPPCP
jgi:hypothetical protein